MNKIYFTLCSNNYLAHAATLGKSIKQYDQESKFIIGLVDKKDSTIDYGQFSYFEIIPCFDLGYSEFTEMLVHYNIIEFNTAVKPYYFEYLFRTRPEVDRIYYIDPDILLYQPIESFDIECDEADILLTPNLVYLPESTSTGELASLRHGVNNLGFIGIKRGTQGLIFIQWWKDRLRTHCKIDKCRGIFVDQKWVDLAPLFFDRIKSIKHPGWNMAWWNFSERKLLKSGQTLYVNSEEYKLIFFHFSGFKPGNRQITERFQSDEFTIDDDHLLQSLFDDYEKRLYSNGLEYLSNVKPLLQFKEVPDSSWIRFGKKVKSKSNNLIFRIFKV
ncbi:hypothetical protein [Algoriphagus resistens]|uniref:hypothetical protein n=1 Tax=Algoriphagus resistens TaxID=1750590 RepID=UPI000716B516|nr:hypothetical protein [Algoriphagus resistens]